MVPSFLFTFVPYLTMVAAGLLVLSLFSLALGRPTSESRDNFHVLRSRSTAPQGFTWRQKAGAETMLNLRIALVSNNATGVETALYDVSNPSSENYGHHLTKAEVRYALMLGFLGESHSACRSRRWSLPQRRVWRRSRHG